MAAHPHRDRAIRVALVVLAFVGFVALAIALQGTWMFLPIWPSH